jgi:hypothetical protein
MRALYEMHPVQRQARRRSHLRCAPIRSPVVLGSGQRNRIRVVLQPVTRCRDSRLRCGWPADQGARARGRVQGVVPALRW